MREPITFAALAEGDQIALVVIKNSLTITYEGKVHLIIRSLVEPDTVGTVVFGLDDVGHFNKVGIPKGLKYELYKVRPDTPICECCSDASREAPYEDRHGAVWCKPCHDECDPGWGCSLAGRTAR